MPASAALALSLRCRSSGTFRNWIIFGMGTTYMNVLRISNALAMVPFRDDTLRAPFAFRSPRDSVRVSKTHSTAVF